MFLSDRQAGIELWAAAAADRVRAPASGFGGLWEPA